MLKNHRKASDSESESAEIDEEQQKYSLDNLDNKILEMKQNFAAPQTPVNSNKQNKQKIIPAIVTNPQDVVKSHCKQVQSRIQDALGSMKINDVKDDYFLASSASETSLNESLKSGNLDEHEVIYNDPDHERSGASLHEEDIVQHDVKMPLMSNAHSKYKEVFQHTPSSSSGKRN